MIRTVTIPEHRLARTAARDNAARCAAKSRSHGMAGEFGLQARAASARTPLRHHDAVTLVPGAGHAALVARIDTTVPAACAEDGFADLGLTAAGFQVLFEAQGIHRPASVSADAGRLARD
ncbi:hypothetical protein GCM10010129_44040 [Streptomyces fumigatiscleroticus]|nr:hypothetical protein GCM10010129_44040 [Streptomyces fumigatiscleroticus]